ncbi:16S rRNA (guanine(966)-N(2))-methyltransferase RsmD [Parvibaculum sp.]|jgi:16S rRNA (guanine966-N2)-methyltransferase|uniref:16S rRNA (guanine(966)-N(2))-methyltransferase RsmD n=1 Tax=Parvibaculum sp. TaxID=2024848 RepID=UPI000C68ABE4|nr:16S rRNA (guanine(966)-N(2))-methyltransferase RsmD [Parvibaculum sp.]MAM95575.1 16S rRNA (guanine(966)-N(2))-methyltransferase RsmD [Parvibaculum sp.]HCX67538.1 16S rRNA (guanine(966)-N(2))-methyltransferase RsmD [Rhodobiaceae bacterium]|tara:strand:+ start:19397 stop:19963 length:567 start_codon:yes stop_codon:yes gene_type:complete
MRIVGGALRGRAITAPKRDTVRPTSDRTREALFNILAHADFGSFELEGARVLDLFAGTGALGIEAISRGAAFALFVEDNAESRGAIRENLEYLGLNGNAKIYRRDATRLGPRPGSVGPAFSLVFADPPYGKGLGSAALLSAREGGWLTPDALCIVEETAMADFEAPEGFEELDRRRYRDTEVVFMRLA